MSPSGKRKLIKTDSANSSEWQAGAFAPEPSSKPRSWLDCLLMRRAECALAHVPPRSTAKRGAQAG